HLSLSFLFLMHRPPPRSTPFPYTTLFRSERGPARGGGQVVVVPRPVEPQLVDVPVEAAVQHVLGAVHAPGVAGRAARGHRRVDRDRKSTRLNSSHVAISYAVFCLKKKKRK